MTLKLHAMTCGWLTMPYPLLMDGEEGLLKVPIPSYLIEHPKGTVLFDTGMPLEAREEKEKHIGVAADLFTLHYSPEEQISARLEAAGRDIAKVDYLVNSHLHFDHAGGNSLVPNARLVVQRKEWEAGTVPELCAANHFNPAHFDLGHDRLEVDGEHDLFGDGSVVCVPTYGHTPGHQSLKVRLEDGEVVLCADACYFRKTIEDMRLPQIVNDPEEMRRSLKILKALEAKGARLIYGHDPEFWPKVNEGPLQAVSAGHVARALA